MDDIKSLKILIIIILSTIFFYLIYIILYNKQNENFNMLDNKSNILNKNKIHDKMGNVITECEKNKLESNIEIENLKQELSEKNQKEDIRNNYTKYNKSVHNLIIRDIYVPKISFKDKIIIDTDAQLNQLIAEANQFKTNYNVGDIVSKSSNFNVTADDICYKNDINAKRYISGKHRYVIRFNWCC